MSILAQHRLVLTGVLESSFQTLDTKIEKSQVTASSQEHPITAFEKQLKPTCSINVLAIYWLHLLV